MDQTDTRALPGGGYVRFARGAHCLWDADAPGSGAPPSWQRGSRAAEERVTFHVPLVGANRGVEEMLSRVSDPLSPDYGNYLSPEELAQEFAAPADVQARVEAFFAQYDDVSCGSVGGASLTCRASAAAVERIFHTRNVQV